MSLPFTPFEELMLLKGVPDYPSDAFICLRFHGCIDRERLDTGLAAIWKRHPLLFTKLEYRRKRPFWNIDQQRIPKIDWSEQQGNDPFSVTQPIDLEQGGMRLFVESSGEKSSILIRFHHSCCDGLGILHFVHDLMKAYAEANQQAGTPLKREDPSDERFFGNRTNFRWTWRNLFLLPAQLIGLHGVYKFLSRVPARLLPLPPTTDSSESPLPRHSYITRRFDKQTTAEYLAFAKGKGCTVNDFLIRDVFVAIDRFRKQQGVDDGEQWIRMMMPINMRENGAGMFPTANVVSSVFLDRRGRDIAESDRLLDSIRQESKRIKNFGLGFSFDLSLKFLRLIPGGLRRSAQDFRHSPSVVFSNLGKAYSDSHLPTDEQGELICGNIRLTDFDIMSPLTKKTCAVFALITYANQFSMTLTYERATFDETKADQLISLLNDLIRNPSNPR